MDHKVLGLKAGLEIHQQLNTHKLFCKCPSLLRSDEPDFTVERELHAVVGETGKVDVAAAYEKQKQKTFTYQVFDTNCLVELDEEPPHDINEESLTIALQIALLLNCEIFPVTQIMRKTVIDGSNTSGFQRTVLIAHDGYIETSEGKVRIETLALEEDSARKVEDAHGKRVYSLDRLGIPLVEITTAPDLNSPEQIKEAALKIGEILRACDVRRGIGTIRQDVNVSIKNGSRVEIKGFQDAKIMIDTVKNEMKRQSTIHELKQHFKKANVSQIKDVSSVFKDTANNMMQSAFKKQEGVFGFTLTGMNGIMGKELQPSKRVGTDVSDYAKPVSGIKGIIHSDEELSKYECSLDEIDNVSKELNKKKDDAFVLIVGSKEQAQKARDAIEKRLNLLANGTPKEVRKANPNATTSYLRPMPGAARMYPETDCKLLRIKRDRVDSLKKELPKLASEHKKYLDEFGLNDELIKLLLKNEKVEDFKELITVTDHYDTIAKSLTVFKKEIAKKENLNSEQIDAKLNLDVLAEVLGKIGEEITPNDVKPILTQIVQGKSLKEATTKKEIDLATEIQKLLKEKPGLSQGAYMGLIMGKFKGHVTGADVAKELGKVLK